MNPAQQKANAKKFVERWLKEPGNEEQQSRSFWIQLVEEVLGIPNATHFLEFERTVGNANKRMDVFYEDMKILIEQKSRGVSLDAALNRGKDKDSETAYQQACWYANHLPFSLRPRWIITCNFDEIRIYDQEREDLGSYESINLVDLPDEYWRLSFFTDRSNSRIEKEKQLSIQAGEIVGKLYDQLSQQYLNIETDKHEQYSLNVLIVRLVFLLYAEDADLLHEKDAFLNYLKNFEASQIRGALINLFEVLDTPVEERDPYLSEELAAFPYINGGLYSKDIKITIPQFTENIKVDLLLNASQEFNWSNISPTIFGAVFESTLNPETRRAGGMHYTSVENIHKVIDPLFLNDLKEDLKKIEGIKGKSLSERRNRFRAFQEKLSRINIFDPACGSGNFLTESYLSLRKLENRAIESIQGNQASFDIDASSVIKVSISQFYGIEINDFAVSVAKTALWIAEEQMMEATQEIVMAPFDFLPLKSNSNIHEGNALRMDWNDVLPAEKCNYICGNPPFIGCSLCTAEQKQDVVDLFGKIKLSNSLDYVAGWYYKSCDYMMRNSSISGALVSTNSITQGELVYPLWHTLIQRFRVFINFAYKTFVWDSEASSKAHVHCVIIGFSLTSHPKKRLYFSDGTSVFCKNISPYLVDAPSVLVDSRTKPICNAPLCALGNTAKDKGNLTLNEEEYQFFSEKYPKLIPYMKRFIGGKDFLQNKGFRYCFWFKDATPSVYEGIPELKERFEKVKEFREASTSKDTRKTAATPHLFFRTPYIASDYLIIPRTTSERREYLQIGFMNKESIGSDAVMVIYNATRFHFGILSSRFHSAWTRAVAGRLKSDYRYSGVVVYNNFIWPGTVENPDVPVEEAIPADVRAKVESCAQAVLDARDNHPDKSLADLYDPDKMPSDLLAAHKALDKAVEEAYGVNFNGDEEKIIAHLFKLYAEMTKGE